MTSTRSGYHSSASIPRRRRPATWAFLLLFGLLANPALADVSKEYQLKAAFLYNFTKFVEWPPGRFADDASPIVIGVVGPNPFGDELEKVVRDRKVNGRSIVVVQLESAADARPVHAVFVAAGEESRIEKQLCSITRAGVLTVGESERFAVLDGCVTFTMVKDKVRFEINMTSAEEGGLKISAQLQKLATVVRRRP